MKEEEPDYSDFLFNSTFFLKRKISAGSFGVVFCGLNKYTKEEVAIKLEEVQTNNEDQIRSVQREVKFLCKLNGLTGIPKLIW